MADERRQGGVEMGGAARPPAAPPAPEQAMTMRRHPRVPTVCALCGASGFSSVIEVTSGALCLLHWVAPPPGWYLLREARPERGAPLLRGRCPACMDQLFAIRP